MDKMVQMDNLGKDGSPGLPGATGNGIASITKTSTSGLVDTYTITFTNGNTTTFDVTNGKSITNISKTSTSGLEDIYTITYNDNTTSTFTVTNGNGISSIEKTETQGNVDTYTIYYTNGTTSTFTVTNSTVTDQEFEELQERTEYLGKYANALIKQNSSGTDLTINDTAECPMPIVLSPSELSQATTTGKNLLAPAFQTDTKSQVTCTYTKKGWLLNGTYSGSGTYTSFNIFSQTLEAGTYSINGLNGASGSTFQLDVRKNNEHWIYVKEENRNFTLTESSLIELRLFAYSGYGAFNNLLLPYQLELGDTSTPYEEYTGKKASPNPDYPQDVHVITGDNTINIINQNLFDVNKRLTGSINQDGDIYWTARKVPFYKYPFKENTSYTISGYFKTSGAGNGKLSIVYTDGTFDNSSLNTSNATEYIYKKAVTPSNKTINYIGTTYGSNGTAYIKKDTLMIAEGDVDNYVSHQEQSPSLTLDNLEYCKIGDYSDIFFKNTTDSEYYDSTLELDKWYLKKNILKTTDTSGSTGITINDMVSNSEIKSYYGGTVNDKTITYDSAISGENTIYYPTTTPQDILLNNTLQSELEQIYNWVLSYQDQTNISQTNYDLPFVINATTCYDLNKLLTRVEVLEAEQ
jgi:hypothetical protein